MIPLPYLNKIRYIKQNKFKKKEFSYVIKTVLRELFTK